MRQWVAKHVSGNCVTDTFSRSAAARFMRFALLSGIGWLLDFCSYSVIVEFTGLQPSVANFISSYVGVTFVYFTSLRFVFGRAQQQAFHFILIYWTYHFFSTIAYSGILQVLVNQLNVYQLSWSGYTALEGKIIITPFNLLTNFAFMSFLGRYMRSEIERHRQ